jgi:hypothetical protein
MAEIFKNFGSFKAKITKVFRGIDKEKVAKRKIQGLI